MDCEKTGALIKRLRIEKGLTQKQLAEKMNISDKTVSKWERGLGCPDVSLLNELSSILEINLENILSGDLYACEKIGGNMKKSKYYVCPECGSITLSSGGAQISCCGRPLEALTPKKADEHDKLSVEEIENDWYVTSDHPMTKENYISFVAFATGDRVDIVRQYPQWNMQARFQRRGHGMLLWFSRGAGLTYMLI